MGVMPDLGQLVERHARAVVEEALADTRVVLVNGARQAGKSTLTRLVAAGQEAPVVTRMLDDPAVLRSAQTDPAEFVEHQGLMVIDEIQLAAEMLSSIKLDVDLDPRPGRFLLTGSSNLLSLQALPDALPGRMEIVELWPLSQGEIAGAVDRFVDAAFARGPDLEFTSDLRKRDYLDRAVAGGFPEAVRRTQRRRAAFFDSYLATLIERDVLHLATIERRGELIKLLSLLASRMSGLYVPAAIAQQSGIPRTTLARYVELLAAVFLIKLVPAWSSGGTGRAIGTPKLAFVDSGIASSLIGQDSHRLSEPGGASGAVLENFVSMELARQLTWNDERVRQFHFRTRDQAEVDVVLETPDGRVVGIEVKAGATIRTDDLSGLRTLQRIAGDRFVAGYVLYTGAQTLPFGPRLRAVPIEALWRCEP